MIAKAIVPLPNIPESHYQLKIYNRSISGIMMMTLLKYIKIIMALLMGALSFPIFAEEVMVYPAQGQSPDQLSRDRYECHMWAVQQSGFDPTSGASGSQANASKGSVGREALRGGFRGAAAGAAIGAIAGDAGKGAAIGATAGGLKRGFGQMDANKSGQSSGYDEAGKNYNRALSACLIGRGYSVQ